MWSVQPRPVDVIRVLPGGHLGGLYGASLSLFATRSLGKRFGITTCGEGTEIMKSFRGEDHLKRVDALRDQLDLFRHQCDSARAEAMKRRRRKAAPPRRRNRG